MATHCGHGLLDLYSMFWCELVQTGFELRDQPTDPGDLILRGQCLGAGSVVEVLRREEFLAVAEQIIEVNL